MNRLSGETVTTIERTINSQKVVSFARGDADEGNAIVQDAEAQDAYWGINTIDRIRVLDTSQIPAESLFALSGGSISSAGRFEIEELAMVMKCLQEGKVNSSI